MTDLEFFELLFKGCVWTLIALAVLQINFILVDVKWSKRKNELEIEILECDRYRAQENGACSAPGKRQKVTNPPPAAGKKPATTVRGFFCV